MAQYKILFRRFVNAFPAVWYYSLHVKELDKHWRDQGNFDKQVFLEVDKCKGISELQDCLAKDIPEAASEADEKKEEEDK